MDASRLRVTALAVCLWTVVSLAGCGGRPRSPDGVPAASVRDLPRAELMSAGAPEAGEPPAQPPAVFARLVERVASQTEPAPALRAVMPESLAELSYDAYRSIRFRPERSLWRGEPGRFEVQFFHPGFGFDDLVDVHVVEGDAVRPYPFSPQLFSYGLVESPPSGAGLGFTGLRVHGPIKRPDYRDEIIVFQGASYFRSLGRDQVYGLSARALAVDMGARSGEEFPRFVDFHLVRPGPEDTTFWVVATLDSARARGVYAFHVRPGVTTTIDVTARVWADAGVEALGIAPLSSMFLFGEEAPASFGDFRPEVHDSDGMAFLSRSGEWLYRPLRNPRRTTRSMFRLDSPRGFGLVQRDRSFRSYEDLEAHYQDRPTAFIEPVGDWGEGALHLLEIATEQETDDNIALAWVPDVVPPEGLSLRYRIHFGPDVPGAGPGGKAIATRMTRTPRGARFVVDFKGPQVDPTAVVAAHIDARAGRIIEQHELANPYEEAIRVSFEVAPDEGASDVELRAFLRAGDDVLTETWSYLWQPNP